MNTNFGYTFKRELLLEKKGNQSLVIQNSYLFRELSQKQTDDFSYHKCVLVSGTPVKNRTDFTSTTFTKSFSNGNLKVRLYYNILEDIIKDMSIQQTFAQEYRTEYVEYALELYDNNSELKTRWEFIDCSTLSFGYRYEKCIYCLELSIDYSDFVCNEIKNQIK